MSEGTARFGLPYILPGQAQKELFHNEALARVDALLHAAVETGPRNSVPPAPLEGQCWIVGAGAGGAWAGQAHKLAAWTDGGWRFISPRAGTRAWNRTAGYWIHWNGAAWSSGEVSASRIEVGGLQVVAGRHPAILTPSGGTVIDAEARAAVSQIIATLMSHGLIG